MQGDKRGEGGLPCFFFVGGKGATRFSDVFQTAIEWEEGNISHDGVPQGGTPLRGGKRITHPSPFKGEKGLWQKKKKKTTTGNEGMVGVQKASRPCWGRGKPLVPQGRLGKEVFLITV